MKSMCLTPSRVAELQAYNICSFLTFDPYWLVISQAASSQWGYSYSKKPWKTFMCAKTTLWCSLWRWERRRGTEHACISAYSKSVCMSVLACQTDCVHVHAFCLLLCLPRGEADHWGQDKATSGSRYVVLSEYSSFYPFTKEPGQYVLIWYVIFAQRQFVQDIPPG